jgi:hypothetical protein
MWPWIVENKEWRFSGAAISVLGIIWWVFTKLRGSKREFQPTTAVANTVTQSPTITVSPTFNFPQEPRSAEPPHNQTVSVRFKHSSVQEIDVNYTGDSPHYPARLHLGDAGSMIQVGGADRDSVMLVLPAIPPLMVDSPKADEKYATGGDLYGFFPDCWPAGHDNQFRGGFHQRSYKPIYFRPDEVAHAQCDSRTKKILRYASGRDGQIY